MNIHYIKQILTIVLLSLLSLSASAREVVIPEGTVSIDADSGYMGDTTITSIVFPKSLETIGDSALSGCVNLRRLDIPENVQEIGGDALWGCDNIDTLIVRNRQLPIGKGVGFYDQFSYLECSYYTYQKSYRLSPTHFRMTEAPDTIFFNSNSLTTKFQSLILPENVIYLDGNYSFDYLDASLKLYCEGSYNSQYVKNFYHDGVNVRELKSIVIPDGTTKIKSYAFEGCTSLTSVEIPNSVTKIGSSAFESCTGLTSVEIPSSVTEIGSHAFSGCTALENVEIPSSVTKMGSYAFYGCIVSLPYDLWAKNTNKSVSIGNRIRLTTAPDTVDCLNKSFEYLDLPENVKYVKNYNEIGTLDASLRLYCEGSYNSRYVENFYHDGVNIKELKSIVIPDGTTKIKSSAFKSCTGLTSVEIPSSVTEIGYYAFYDCTGLTSVVIEDGVTSIGQSAFSGCTALESVEIPSSVTEIGSSAFSDCTGLTSVVIEDGVTSIGQSAFSSCTALENVEIPSSVTEIGYYAFKGCIVSLPYDLWTKNNSIGEKIRFTTAPDTVDCLNKSFEYLDLPESVIYVKNYNEIGTLDASLRLYCEGSYNSQYVKNFYHDGVNVRELKSIVIPDGTTKIKSYVFEGCTSLTSVEIPSSVTEIGSHAFSGCTALENVEIPSSVTEIGSHAFSGCTALENVEIPSSVTEIGSSAFEDCTGLTSVEIPSSVTEIGSSAFEDCTGLTSVEIPNSVTKIGSSAFESCTGLTSVEIPSSVTEIGSSAFEDCTGLTSVEIPSSVTEIGSSAFKGCTGLTSVVIEDGVTKIGSFAFESCTGLTSVEIPSSVTEIGSSAFEDCTGLTSVEIPNSVTKIGRDAFESCTGLTSVEIPSSVTEIGSFAFSSCTGLTSVEIPSSVTEIGYYAFYDCTGLTSVVIEDGVTSIGQSAFSGCTALESVEIPSSVTEIRYYAFSGCTGLTSIEIPNSVTEIGPSAFKGCTGLTSVEVPNSVTEIGSSVFEDCTGLTSVVISNSVTLIKDYAFEGCDDLKKITCLSNIPPTMSEKSFPSFMAYLYVPCESYSKYDLHEIWGQFKHIECVGAETIVNPITNVEIQPGIDDAYFTWPVTSNAESYTLKINKDGEVLCTLIFNANGQLTSIDFSGLRSGTTGFQFNVTGLREDSQYTYSMEAKDADNNVLKSYSGEFKTLKKGDGVDDIYDEKIPIAVNGETISIDAEENLMISIFDMKGQCLYKGFGNVVFKAPSSGVYVVKYGSFATKVVVK